ncbi:MAG TPA: ATP-binding protein [Rhodanobacteraceae bacterium]|nr:ATP-binding protein [Rhodanobacteraceae bacterium]
MAIPDTGAGHALILAPAGRDAAVAQELLRQAGIAARTCADLGQLSHNLGDDVAFAVITQEALRLPQLDRVSAWVKAQQSWSDLAFIVLAPRGGREHRRWAEEVSAALGNITFLERPFHPNTFVSAAKAAVKARQRQYEARARIAELHEGERRLVELNRSLEDRVAKRTAALERAHKVVLAESEHRRRAESLLRQAQKMETIGQLTGGIAHDFNNLLMVVQGNLDLLRKHCAGDARAERWIGGAVEGARRGASLTQRLLAFARRQDLKLESRNLAELVQGIADLLGRSAGPGIEIVFDLPQAIPASMVDTAQVELAILNLVVNARDAMPEGGLLTVAVSTGEAQEGHELAPGAYVRLSVTDTGQGMDAETLERAMEPFFSTKGPGKGTGLGLSMVHGLAQQLGGALELASEPGRGTRAELWLPVAAAVASKPAEHGLRGLVGGARKRSAHILVVDDDALVARSTAALLEDLGHQTILAESGHHALKILRAEQNVDLLITDYLMPRMTGAELAREVRGFRPDLPILLATGYAELSAGLDFDLPRLNKPYQQHELQTRIDQLLH